MNTLQRKGICPGCGTEFSESSPVCPECYRAFEEEFAATLSALYGSPTHRGHAPARFGEKTKRERRVAELREALSGAIRSEDFELACKLRDELRGLTSEVEKNVLV